MRYKEYYKVFLNEMVEQMSQPDGDVVIAFHGKIWRLDSDENDFETSNKILKDISQKTGLPEIDEINDLFNIIDSYRPDIFIGRIYNNKLVIKDYITDRGPYSLTVKKIIQFYKLDGVEVSTMDDYEIFTPKEKLKESGITTFAYHGTSLNSLFFILKKGLMGGKKSNWSFNFPDRVFLSNRIAYALFHATNAARKNNSFPIILKVQIPDKSLIVPDYDVAVSFGIPDAEKYNYDIKYDPKTYRGEVIDNVRKHSSKTDFTKETGVFAYKGRIPSSFIKKLYFRKDNSNDFNVELSEFSSTSDKKEMEYVYNVLTETGGYYYLPEELEDE